MRWSPAESIRENKISWGRSRKMQMSINQPEKELAKIQYSSSGTIGTSPAELTTLADADVSAQVGAGERRQHCS